MKWIAAVISVASDVLSLSRYGRPIGIAFGVLLMLISIPCRSPALTLLGVIIGGLTAFWPGKKAE
jgi:hypothetical protein